jgi:hypothetical protein
MRPTFSLSGVRSCFIRDSIISGKGYGSEEYLQKVEESIKARLRKGRRGRPKKKDV